MILNGKKHISVILVKDLLVLTDYGSNTLLNHLQDTRMGADAIDAFIIINLIKYQIRIYQLHY